MAGNQHLTPRPNRTEPNIVIDGGMEIWPEGTSRSIANNASAYGPVLFQYNNISSGVTATYSRQASIPAGTNVPFSSQVSKTAAGTLAAGTRETLHYHIEGYDIQRLMNREFSLIFWVKSSVASNRSCAIRNVTTTHSYVQQYNISAINTWQLKVLRFDALSTCPGTLNRTNGEGLRVSWDIVTGTTFQTATLGSWVSGDFSSGTGEDTTWLTGTTHDFSIAGVMILPGDWTSLSSNTSSYDFVRAGKNFEEEVAMSQRYYEKSYDLDTPPTTTGVAGWRATAPHGGNPQWDTPYKVSKRATPTPTFYNSTTGATTTYRNETAGTDIAASSTKNRQTGFTTHLLTATEGQQYAGDWTADARF